MRHFLFLFLDGVGLGEDDPEVNPLARAEMPTLHGLTGGRLLRERAPAETAEAALLALDARMGVEGVPQSATGQATLLTGRNIPAEVGYHYGPKPNPEVSAALRNGSLFNRLNRMGKRSALLNAYPPGYFAAIESGRRLYSAIPLAITSAGLALKTAADLKAGRALAADFTAQVWRDHLKIDEAPLLAPEQAGERMAALAQELDFAFFEYWLSDYAGHKQDMPGALALLRDFDRVLAGLLSAWDDSTGLILITSDHGNLEDLSTRRHTLNPVPGVVIGRRELRREFTESLHSLADVTPAILRFLAEGNGQG